MARGILKMTSIKRRMWQKNKDGELFIEDIIAGTSVFVNARMALNKEAYAKLEAEAVGKKAGYIDFKQ